MDITSLKLDDLFVVCDKCKGKKEIVQGSSGPGYATKMISFGPCNKCNGLGGQLTDLGKVLKQFIWMVENRQV